MSMAEVDINCFKVKDESELVYIKSQEFLIALTAKNYESALTLAREILVLDPKNDLFNEYQTILLQKIQMEDTQDSSELSSDNSSSNDSSDNNSGSD